jgi:hypothetical protein
MQYHLLWIMWAKESNWSGLHKHTLTTTTLTT